MEPGAVRTRHIQIAAGVCAALFASAFVAAPKSCDGGLTAYFFAGVACLIGLFAMPLMFGRGLALGARYGLAFAFAVAVFVTWIAGGAIANVRIMCRLF